MGRVLVSIIEKKTNKEIKRLLVPSRCPVTGLPFATMEYNYDEWVPTYGGINIRFTTPTLLQDTSSIDLLETLGKDVPDEDSIVTDLGLWGAWHADGFYGGVDTIDYCENTLEEIRARILKDAKGFNVLAIDSTGKPILINNRDFRKLRQRWERFRVEVKFLDDIPPEENFVSDWRIVWGLDEDDIENDVSEEQEKGEEMR